MSVSGKFSCQKNIAIRQGIIFTGPCRPYAGFVALYRYHYHNTSTPRFDRIVRYAIEVNPIIDKHFTAHIRALAHALHFITQSTYSLHDGRRKRTRIFLITSGCLYVHPLETTDTKRRAGCGLRHFQAIFPDSCPSRIEILRFIRSRHSIRIAVSQKSCTCLAVFPST